MSFKHFKLNSQKSSKVNKKNIYWYLIAQFEIRRLDNDYADTGFNLGEPPITIVEKYVLFSGQE